MTVTATPTPATSHSRISALRCRISRLNIRSASSAITVALWLSVIVAVDSIAQIAMGFGRARGPFASPNFLGYYAVCHCFLALARRNKSSIPIAVANAMVVLASQSRASWLALAIGAWIMLPRGRSYRPSLLWFGRSLALALMAGAFFLSDHASNRLSIWRYGIGVWARNPWFGSGSPDNIVLGLPGFYSVPLDWAVRFGLAGLAAAVCVLILSWRRAGTPMRAFLAAWLVNGLFIYGTPESTIPLLLALWWLWSGGGLDEPDGAARIDDGKRGQPLIPR